MTEITGPEVRVGAWMLLKCASYFDFQSNSALDYLQDRASYDSVVHRYLHTHLLGKRLLRSMLLPWHFVTNRGWSIPLLLRL